MLFYSVYAYLFYAVAAAFNQFFLLYVATFGLPSYALLFSVPRLDLTPLGNAMGGRAARVVAITYTGVVAAGLGRAHELHGPADSAARTAAAKPGRRVSRRPKTSTEQTAGRP